MIDLLAHIIQIYSYVLIVRVFFSWLPPESRRNRFYELLYIITEPALLPVRNLIPDMGGFDFSPIIVFLILQALVRFLIRYH